MTSVSSCERHDGDAQALAGIVHSRAGVALGPEDARLAVLATKCLVAVEHGLAVVQHGDAGLDGERLVGNDFGLYSRHRPRRPC